MEMSEFFGVMAAGPMFFVSAWVLMLFGGIVDHDLGTRSFGYGTAMVATIGLWLVVAPAVGAIMRSTMKQPTCSKEGTTAT